MDIVLRESMTNLTENKDIAYIDDILEMGGWTTIDENNDFHSALNSQEKQEMLRNKLNEIIYAFKKLEYEVGLEPV